MRNIQTEKAKEIKRETLIVTVDISKVANVGYCRCPNGIDIKPFSKDIPYSKFLLSIKGIGEVTVAGLIGEVGDFREYKTISEVLKLGGLDLFEISSGKHKGQRRISKRGRPLMRKLLFFAAINVVREGGIMHKYYQGCFDRGMSKMKALIAVSSKLLDIMFALVRDHSEYIDGYTLGGGGRVKIKDLIPSFAPLFV